MGIDFSKTMVETARRNVPEAIFKLMDMTDIDLVPESFDGVISTYAIIHVPREKHARIFQSFCSILRSVYPFPDLLTFHDAPTPIEQRLFVMFLEHRMRAFQGTFHANPDYALWYGWSEMVQDLTEIKAMAADMRHGKKQ